MFCEKKLHYLIVAALATSLSSDALAAANPSEINEVSVEGNEEKSNQSLEYQSMRASSAGFADPQIDPVYWVQDDLVQTSRLSDIKHATRGNVEDVCKHSEATCGVSNSELTFDSKGRMKLPDGKTFQLQAICFDGGEFSTTLAAQRPVAPIEVDLDEIKQHLDEDGLQIIQWYQSELKEDQSARDLEFASEIGQNYQWRFKGHVIADSNKSSTFEEVEGRLPLKVQLRRYDKHAPIQLAIAVDGEELAKQLKI